MSKRINWPIWFVSSGGLGWAIYIASQLKPEDIKGGITAVVLMIVSIVLLETGARRAV